MPEHKKAQKPTGSIENAKVAQGLEKPTGSSEVSGHGVGRTPGMSAGAFYSCSACGTVNWVPYGSEYFYCWNCYALNRA